MGDPNKGTETLENNENSEWFIVHEADCVDDSLNVLDELFEESTSDSVVSNLIDDDQVDQGNSLALFNSQITDDCNNAILYLKRKYIASPEKTIADISPRLAAVSISPQRNIKKRLLFQDSGIVDDEAENSDALAQVDVLAETSRHDNDRGNKDVLSFLKCTNFKAMFLAKFKELFAVSFTDLTRQFKSDKTCNDNWVLILYKVSEEIVESSKVILQNQCNYLQIIMYEIVTLYLLNFKTGKSRETVSKMFISLFNIDSLQILSEPPRTRSVAAALFFFTKRMSNACYHYGELPDWIKKLTMVNHQVAAAAETFDLSTMVQWAWDNKYTEEHEIAFKYAQLADIDCNAAAFLRSNQQARFVRDCTHMVRLYRRHEMRQMTMSEWINKCCNDCTSIGEWKTIAAYLRYENINVISFLTALRQWFKCIPKKNCMVFYGPPDTGKSYFAFSLINFLKGKVISMMNRQSQFWLMPLQDGKIGLLDDCTYQAWQFIDVNMRAALDGNYISLDSKHRAPAQMKLPPLLVTTNHDVMADLSLKYLHSRVTAFHFPSKMPIDDYGNPVYIINDETWKSFFIKLATQLDLQFEEDDESGRLERPFRLTAGSTPDSL
uniref:Replication protein E1 n=1 Tax=Human papillomavirus TaxID=10566 RepID=A0A385PRC9_9PAPI|nr:MAG: E1 protein [Human papillomavirus]